MQHRYNSETTSPIKIIYANLHKNIIDSLNSAKIASKEEDIANKYFYTQQAIDAIFQFKEMIIELNQPKTEPLVQLYTKLYTELNAFLTKENGQYRIDFVINQIENLKEMWASVNVHSSDSEIC